MEFGFVFTACQVGAEKALKEEIARLKPELRFAFSKPGFLTFKNVGPEPLTLDWQLESVFARSYGLSIGKTAPETTDANSKILATARTVDNGKPLRLHFWKRDEVTPQDRRTASEELPRPPDFLLSADIFSHRQPAIGDLVFDLMVLDEATWWMGVHKHSITHSPFPGGITPIVIPEKSPSRAFLKIEESILWTGAPVRADDVVVELGSAPGGSTYALLERGLRVTGIDPAEMDPSLVNHPRFQHIQSPVADVGRGLLPPSIQWLVLDMNVAPGVSLYAIDHYVARMQDSLLGVLLTVKLNEWRMAKEIPSLLAHVRAMGIINPKAKQLAHHGQEILIYGLTKMGERRKQARRSS